VCVCVCVCECVCVCVRVCVCVCVCVHGLAMLVDMSSYIYPHTHMCRNQGREDQRTPEAAVPTHEEALPVLDGSSIGRHGNTCMCVCVYIYVCRLYMLICLEHAHSYTHAHSHSPTPTHLHTHPHTYTHTHTLTHPPRSWAFNGNRGMALQRTCISWQRAE
jgi:hypothetical protein